ncbi:MAG: precorrin-4 C(11)-methyltransferase [Desulfobacteraceae bacterium]|jgi:precorrin-4/cobalt-precorrin-4 C11-methyltransferase
MNELTPISTSAPSLHPIIFCGAGPGDPELITVKGQKALNQADIIVYAGSLVPEAVLRWKNTKAETINSASLHLDEIIAILAENYFDGRKVVRLHTGDPALYGAIFEQMAKLYEKEIPYLVIPGVTAAFAAAATMGIEYTLPEISQTLILTRMAGRTPVPEMENLRSLAAHQASMAIYLSITLVDKVAAVLTDAYGPDSPCAIVYRASQPEERIVYTTADHLVETVKKEKITHQALIIASRVLEVVPHNMKTFSKLYDKGFAHGYRKAEEE